jgi:hypothetical protein
MTVEERRKVVASAYPGKRWQEKVAKMSEYQLETVYWKLLYQGKLR